MDEPERILSLKEAAAILGVSSEAVRQRVRRGTLPGSKVQSATGPMWVVPASAVHALAVHPHPLASAPSTPDVAPQGLAALEPTSALLDRLEFQAERIGRLEAELAAVRAERDALQALSGPRHGPPTPDPVPSAHRPWWRRLLGR